MMPTKSHDVNRIIEELAEEIRWAVRQTNLKNLEYGLMICEGKGGILRVSRCSGDKCSLETPECGRNQKTIGSMHTHPSGMLIPTPEDIGDAYLKGEEFFCIANKRGNLRCWEVAKYNDTFKELIKWTIASEQLAKDPMRQMQVHDRASQLLLNDIIYKEGKIIRQVVDTDIHEL